MWNSSTFRRVTATSLAAGVIATGAILFSGGSTPEAPSPTVTATIETTTTEAPATTVPATTSTTVPETTSTMVPETTTTTEAPLVIPDEVPAQVQLVVDARGEALGTALFTSVYSGDVAAVKGVTLDGAAADLAAAYEVLRSYRQEAGDWDPSRQGMVLVPFVATTPLGNDRYLAEGAAGIAHPDFEGAVTNVVVEYRDGEVALVDFTIEPAPYGDAAYWVSDLVLDPDSIRPLVGGQVDSASPGGEGLAGWLQPPHDLSVNPYWLGRDTSKWSAALFVHWSEEAGQSPFANYQDDNNVVFAGWSPTPSVFFGDGQQAALEDGVLWETPTDILYQVTDIPAENLDQDAAGLSAGLDADGYLARYWVAVSAPGLPESACADTPELCPSVDWYRQQLPESSDFWFAG